MLVTEDAIFGTIGGGELERTAMLKARELLHTGGAGARRAIALGPELNQCCGGSVTLAFEPFAPADLAWLQKLIRAAEEPTPIFRTLRFDDAGRLPPRLERRRAARTADFVASASPADRRRSSASASIRRRRRSGCSAPAMSAARWRRRCAARLRHDLDRRPRRAVPRAAARRREAAGARHAGACRRRSAARHDLPGDDAQPSARRGDLRGGAAARAISPISA